MLGSFIKHCCPSVYQVTLFTVNQTGHDDAVLLPRSQWKFFVADSQTPNLLLPALTVLWISSLTDSATGQYFLTPPSLIFFERHHYLISPIGPKSSLNTTCDVEPHISPVTKMCFFYCISQSGSCFPISMALTLVQVIILSHLFGRLAS